MSEHRREAARRVAGRCFIQRTSSSCPAGGTLRVQLFNNPSPDRVTILQQAVSHASSAVADGSLIHTSCPCRATLAKLACMPCSPGLQVEDARDQINLLAAAAVRD